MALFGLSVVTNFGYFLMELGFFEWAIVLSVCLSVVVNLRICRVKEILQIFKSNRLQVLSWRFEYKSNFRRFVNGIELHKGSYYTVCQSGLNMEWRVRLLADILIKWAVSVCLGKKEKDSCQIICKSINSFLQRWKRRILMKSLTFSDQKSRPNICWQKKTFLTVTLKKVGGRGRTRWRWTGSSNYYTWNWNELHLNFKSKV